MISRQINIFFCETNFGVGRGRKGFINYPQEFAKNGKYFNFLDEKYLSSYEHALKMATIRPSHFNNATELEYRRSRLDMLHHHRRVNCREDDLVLLCNTDRREIIGVARLRGTCVKRNLLEHEVHAELRYNKYEIATKSVFMFPKPLKYTDLFMMVGIVPKTGNNISNVGFGTFKPFNIWGEATTPEAKVEIVRRLITLAQTYV